MRAEGADLVLTSGGLGPTADDMTAEVVADFAGRPLQLDEGLEQRIGEIIARFARRWRLDPEALEIANRKQAMVPEGAVALDPVGTAPGSGRAGGRPGRGGAARTAARASGELAPGGRDRAVQGRRWRARRATGRRWSGMFGVPESEIAETLRVADADMGLDGLEITTCLRRGRAGDRDQVRRGQRCRRRSGWSS